jgi:hypothetical protein
VVLRGSRFESSEQLLMLSGLSMKQAAAWIAQVTASGGRYSAAGGEPIAISSPEVLFRDNFRPGPYYFMAVDDTKEPELSLQ